MYTKETERAMTDVWGERNRQKLEEGYSPEHDDEHDGGELVRAARCYADPTAYVPFRPAGAPEEWPWEPESFKPKSYRDNLVRAAALLVAEIERLDRAEEAQP